MANLPYVTAPGNVTRALKAIASASTPEKVTQDFVKAILGIPGGSGDQMTSFLKKIGMAGADGKPTDVYRKFRNAATRGAAAATALKHGYAPLYKRNEFMHELSDSKLRGLIIEETGAGEDSSAVNNTAKCIQNLKAFAEFDEVEPSVEVSIGSETNMKSMLDFRNEVDTTMPRVGGMGLNLSYTINLNLPATTDIAVFNAIFKSLRANLLRSSDE